MKSFKFVFQPFVESDSRRFWFLSTFWDPWAVFRPRTRENGEGQKFFQGVKDHFFVAVVFYDRAITGSSSVQCRRRNALSLHSSILLHIV